MYESSEISMNKLRVVIITYDWPPRNAIASMRPYSWAEDWSKKGACVTVLTAKKKSFDEPLDLFVEEISRVDVRELDFHGPVGSELFIFRYRFIRTFLRNLLSVINKFGQKEVDPRSGWYKAALPVAVSLAQDTDVVVSSYSPASAHYLARDMKKSNDQLTCVADFRDLWALNDLKAGRRKQKQKEVLQELECLSSADLLTTVSGGLAEKLRQVHHKDVYVINNGFDVSLADVSVNLSSYREKRKSTIDLIYTGNVYDGYQDPIPVLEVIKDLIDSGNVLPESFRVQFYGPKNSVVDAVTRNPRFSGFTYYNGHVSRSESLAAQKEATLLLLLEVSSPEAKGVLTGKVFEYMVSGVPIISFGKNSDSSVGDLLFETGAGFSYSPSSLDCLRSDLLAINSGRSPQWFSPNLDKIKNYSRQFQASVLGDVISNNRVENV